MAFDIYKGWPFDGAINDTAKPDSAAAIVAGMFIKKNPGGELIKADGTANEAAFFALQDQASYNVVFSQQLPYIVKNAIVLTDQYVTFSYTIGERLQVSAISPGKVSNHLGAGAPVIGYYDGTVRRDGVDYIKIILAA